MLLTTVSLLNYVLIIVSALNHFTQTPNLKLLYLGLKLHILGLVNHQLFIPADI